MQIEFSDRVVVVTGAGRGIGWCIATSFAERGAEVFAADILPDALEAQLQRDKPLSTAARQRLRLREVDVTEAASVEALIAEAQSSSEQQPAAVDILVHCAGGVLGQHSQALETVREADWRAILDVNVQGAFLSARAVAPGMKQRRRGRIIVISSRAGLGVSLTGIASYGTAKTAQIGLVRQFAAELGEFGITVNSVAPGFMRTSPDYERQWQAYSEAERQAVFNRIAMRRWGEPDDIAHAVMFLASDYASWITGQTLSVGGAP